MNAKGKITIETKNKLNESERERLVLLSLLEDQKETLDKLKESEELFRALAESTATAIFIYQGEKFLYVNEATARITGYSKEELLQMNFWDVVHPDFKELVKQRGLARQRGETIPNRYEIKLMKKDGTIAWVDLSAGKISWAGKEAAIGSAFDITERKAAEEIIEYERNLNRTILNLLPAAIWVKDKEGRKIFVNKAELELSGKNSEDEVIGKTDFELYNETDALKFTEEDKFVIEKGKPILNIEDKITKPDGSEIYLLGAKVPLRNSKNEIIGIVGVNNDITERKKLEDELKEREEKLSLLVEGTPYYFFYTQDENALVTYISPSVEFITGYTPKEWIGNRDWFVSDSPINKIAREKTYAHLRGEKSDEPYYVEIENPAGQKILLEIFEQPIFKDGKVVGLQGVASDVTERRRAEIIQRIQYNIANAVVTSKNLNELFEIVRNELNELIDTKNFFIAFYDEESDMLSSNIDKDEKDEIPVWSAKKSISGYVIKQKRSILLTKSQIQALAEKGIIELIGTLPEAWLGTPLSIGDKIIGVIAIQDYHNPNAYDKTSLEILEIIAKQLSIYIEQKRSEETNIILTRAIEQSPVSIVITDIDGNIKYVNPKFTEVSGYTFEEAIGKNSKFLKSGKTDSSVYVELWNTILSGEDWYGEFINKKKNGEIYFEEAIISPIKNEEGVITNFVAVKEDITEKKKLLDELTKSEIQFRSIWENSIDAMRLIDEDGIIVDVNDAFCKMFQLTKEELIGKPFSVCYLSDEKDTVKSFKEKYISNTIPKKIETEAILHNKKKMWIDVSNSKVEIDGNPPMLLSIFRDITDKKKMIEELIEAKDKAEEMNRIKSHFFATMSHELRTPFVGIMGFAELLADEVENPQHKEMAYRILQSSKRLTTTLNQILDMTKLEFDKADINITNFDAIQIVDDVYLQFEKTAKSKNIDFRRNFKIESLFVNTDERLFSEILINLVNNAVKYTEKGWIEISAERKFVNNKDSLVVKVKDTGIGIPKEKQEIIWQEFRQASEGLSRRFEGTGLGLSIVRRFAELIKAKVYLEESSPNGSTFVVELPIDSQTENETETTQQKVIVIEDVDMQEEKIKKEEIVAKKKILYVEDDAIATEVVVRTLSRQFEIDCVTNSKDALDIVKERNYDLILMDINLGRDESDGIELTQKIRQLEFYKNIPIVALTAYAREEDRDEFLSKGMDYYLSKPFSISDLKKLMEEIFKK
ncbi:MAG: PAS domain S-box protein [Ignavibacteriales bacterium]|nr:PAS domain S-box protein [Ignavibacteriales bacterium]